MADTMTTSEVLAHRRSPARHLVEEMTAGSSAAVRLREICFTTQIGVRAEPGSAAGEGIEAALGVALPRGVGSVTYGPDGQAVLWLAPDEFLLIAPDEAASGVSTRLYVDRLAETVHGHRGQVLDVSANRATLELSGPAARSVLDKSVQIDLHPLAFPVGQAVATLLSTTPTLLWRTGETTWQVMVRASFATHTVHWLVDGMREFAR